MQAMVLRQLAMGILSYVPGLYGVLSGGTGGTNKARYCYSIWLRHLVHAHRSGLDPVPPAIVAELGPGDSLGVGIAALLSGVSGYHALDAVRYASPTANLRILDELVDLFRQRADIPGDEEYPRVRPRLDSYEFPSSILSEELLSESLAPERVRAISLAVENPNGTVEGNDQSHDGSVFLTYHAPWSDNSSPTASSVDMVLSQAVLQSIVDLRPVLWAMLKWLRPGGLMSHQIDLSAVGRAKEWNGHWRYPALLWRLMRGHRPRFLSRRPHSTYLAMMADTGFRIMLDLPVRRASVLRQQDLASEFRKMTDDDLTTCSVFVQAVRP